MVEFPIRKLLQISPGSVGAPNVIAALAATLAMIKNNVAASGAFGGIAACRVGLGGEDALGSRVRVDPMQRAVLIIDQPAVIHPGEAGRAGRGPDLPRVSAARGGRHNREFPVPFAEYGAQQLTVRRKIGR